ncbi:hypothetical protein G9A89_009388 [Geosiphon pyriformis]|nr:hypothetical protein G9A89_009388 [Geosiphon pyriformis]
MNPVGASAGGSGFGLAGLRIQSNEKKKTHVDSVYSCGSLFKKPKISVANDVVDLSTGPLSLVDIGDAGVNLNKAKELAVCKKILVNNNLREINSQLDWEVIIKEVPVDLPKLAVESVFSKFEKIVSIKMQLIGLWQKALVEYESSEIADLVALLYTLLVRTMVHNFSGLMKSYGEKTCFIGCNSSLYVHNKCAVVCFANEASKLAAIGFVLVFKDVNLYWAGLFLACCFKCKHFGHISDMYSVQVTSGSLLHVVLSFSSGTGLFSGTEISSAILAPFGNSGLHDHLTFLKHSVKLLSDQISGILKKLSFVGLVSLVPSSLISPSIASAPLNLCLNLDITVDSVFMPLVSFLTGVNFDVSGFSSSSSKVLTTKVGSLESKIMALDVSVNLVLERLDCLCSGLDFDLVWKIATCNVRGMNNLTKQDDIICWHNKINNLISIVTETKLRDRVHLWIMNKFDDVWVFISGLGSGYLGSGVTIIMNNFLAKYVYKMINVPGVTHRNIGNILA